MHTLFLHLVLAPLAAHAGVPAPDLSPAIHVSGPRIDLTDSDTPILVEVWATWCGPCRETFPTLSALQREHGDTLRVVALTDESVVRTTRFVHARLPDMRFSVLTDPSSETTRALLFSGSGTSGIPSSFLIERGEVTWAGPVSDFGVERP